MREICQTYDGNCLPLFMLYCNANSLLCYVCIITGITIPLTSSVHVLYQPTAVRCSCDGTRHTGYTCLQLICYTSCFILISQAEQCDGKPLITVRQW